MKTSFKQIVKISVKHNYFRDLMCAALHYMPDDNTSFILNRYGFKVRKSLDGFEVYSDFQGDLSAQLDYVKRAMDCDFFLFEITTADPLFYTYTDLPGQWIGSINYSNENLKEGSEGILAPTFKNESDTTIVGTIKLNFSNLSNSENHYTINYDARSTIWNYFIINKGQQALNNPKIDTKGKVNFNSPANVELTNGEKALSFASTERVSLNENPDITFDLVEENGESSRPKIIFRGLPNPSPQNTLIEVVDGVENFRTNMYVYL